MGAGSSSTTGFWIVGGGGRGPVGGGAGGPPIAFVAVFVLAAGGSTAAEAMSSNLEVAASSLRIIAVSSDRETTGTGMGSASSIFVVVGDVGIGEEEKCYEKRRKEEEVRYRLMRVVRLCMLLAAILAC